MDSGQHDLSSCERAPANICVCRVFRVMDIDIYSSLLCAYIPRNYSLAVDQKKKKITIESWIEAFCLHEQRGSPPRPVRQV